MKRYILIFLFSLSSFSFFAQSTMSDSQIIEFVLKENAKGTSQAQIVTKLMQRGVNINQIRRVKKHIREDETRQFFSWFYFPNRE